MLTYLILQVHCKINKFCQMFCKQKRLTLQLRLLWRKTYVEYMHKIQFYNTTLTVTNTDIPFHQPKFH